MQEVMRILQILIASVVIIIIIKVIVVVISCNESIKNVYFIMVHDITLNSMDPKEMVWKDAGWIHLGFVNTVMNFRVLKTRGIS
jgi:hypothetical protein